MVEVKALINSDMLIEVEAEAFIEQATVMQQTA